MKPPFTSLRRVFAAFAVTLLAGCASTPATIPEIEEASSAIDHAARLPDAGAHVEDDLERARAQLALAERSLEENAPLESVVHHAYLARRLAEIAAAEKSEAELRREIRNADVARARVQLEARIPSVR